jgi:hypothetical protein
MSTELRPIQLEYRRVKFFGTFCVYFNPIDVADVQWDEETPLYTTRALVTFRQGRRGHTDSKREIVGTGLCTFAGIEVAPDSTFANDLLAYPEATETFRWAAIAYGKQATWRLKAHRRVLASCHSLAAEISRLHDVRQDLRQRADELALALAGLP